MRLYVTRITQIYHKYTAGGSAIHIYLPQKHHKHLNINFIMVVWKYDVSTANLLRAPLAPGIFPCL